jgi:metacaspase-1
MGRCGVLVSLLVALLGGMARGDGYAIVVGVNDCPAFRLPDGTRPRPLRGAVSDAEAVASLLTGRLGFAAENVLVLKETQATRAAIRGAFDRMKRRVGHRDHFVFHFAGHGTQLDDRPPYDEPDRLDEALCPSDANGRGENLILDDDLGLWLEEISARQVTVILDCCHAGTGVKDAVGGDDLADRFLPIPRNGPPLSRPEQPWRELRGQTKGAGHRTASFFACRPEQRAYERRILERLPPVRAGQFSYYLLEGLRDRTADRNEDGRVSEQELLDYTRRRIDETFNSSRSGEADRQQPVLESDDPDAPALGVSLDIRNPP